MKGGGGGQPTGQEHGGLLVRDPQTAELLAVARRMLTRTLETIRSCSPPSAVPTTRWHSRIDQDTGVIGERGDRARARPVLGLLPRRADYAGLPRSGAEIWPLGSRSAWSPCHSRSASGSPRCRRGPRPRHRGHRRRGRGGVRRLVPPGLGADRRDDRGARPLGGRARPRCGLSGCGPRRRPRGRRGRAAAGAAAGLRAVAARGGVHVGIAVVIAAQQVPSGLGVAEARMCRTPGSGRGGVVRFAGHPDWVVLGLLALSVVLTARAAPGAPVAAGRPAGGRRGHARRRAVRGRRRPDRLVALLPSPAGAARLRRRPRPAGAAAVVASSPGSTACCRHGSPTG